METSCRYFDNIIVGAGLSGISAAYYLKKRVPNRSFVILEMRSDIGGTWDLFKYPGLRSDSDMHTLGFAFKPWADPKAIAGGPAIMRYLHETVEEFGLRGHMLFNRRLLSATYDSDRAVWRLSVLSKENGEQETWECNFLHACAGYYDYDEGHDPPFQGSDIFEGHIVHQQFWPENLDYTDKRVVVIGSGATAVTIVPIMAETARHVIMLQRTPSYVYDIPARDAFANLLRRILPSKWAYGLIRWRNVIYNLVSFNWIRKNPARAKDMLLKAISRNLPRNVVAEHFTPNYNPWDQRICAVPDGDLFDAINQKRASVVTDHIERFTQTGIQLKSGDHLDADIIVKATGLKLNFMGGAALSVDGEAVNSGELLTYKGMMYSDVPNLAVTFGYTNSSWTLKADLTSEYVARPVNHMDRVGAVECVPVRDDRAMSEEEILSFTSGYVQRAKDIMPRQGTRKPWKLDQNYALDIFQLRFGKIDDGVMRFRTRDELSKSNTQRSHIAAE